MTLVSRLGLRSRLAIALAGMAILAVALATAITARGLEGRLSDFSRDRLHTFAEHTAQAAGASYIQQGRFSRREVTQLRHLAQLNGFSVVVVDERGRMVPGSGSLRGRERVSAPIRVKGRDVGRVIIAPGGGTLLAAEDQSLRDRLDRLHLVAAALAVALAVLVALLIAPRLTKPIRRLTGAARRMEQGDLSARLQVEGGGRELAALAHAFDRLAQTLAREEEIRRASAADIAHELGSPVSGLLGRIEAAQDGLVRDEQANLEAMHTEALRLTRFVSDLARLAEAERPSLLVAKTPLDLSAAARRVADRYADLFATNDVTLDTELEPVTVNADESRLEQIIDNLLSNSLRYTEPGGHVTLRVTTASGEAVLDVSDNGIGIAPGDLPHIFTRFWRGEKSRTRATGGAGIGLAIVAELVRAHDGRVEVDSSPGRGSRFRVFFPLA